MWGTEVGVYRHQEERGCSIADHDCTITFEIETLEWLVRHTTYTRTMNILYLQRNTAQSPSDKSRVRGMYP